MAHTEPQIKFFPLADGSLWVHSVIYCEGFLYEPTSYAVKQEDNVKGCILILRCLETEVILKQGESYPIVHVAHITKEDLKGGDSGDIKIKIRKRKKGRKRAKLPESNG